MGLKMAHVLTLVQLSEEILFLYLVNIGYLEKPSPKKANARKTQRIGYKKNLNRTLRVH